MQAHTASTYGIRADSFDSILQVLSTFSEVEEAIIYGSRAKGNYRPGSDIDLVFKGKNLTHQILSAIEDGLEGLLLPYQFDLSIYHQIENPSLIEHIDRVGRIIYAAKGNENLKA